MPKATGQHSKLTGCLIKRPTFSVYELIEGEYQVKQFRGNEPIKSPTFLELDLAAQQVFIKGELRKQFPLLSE